MSATTHSRLTFPQPSSSLSQAARPHAGLLARIGRTVQLWRRRMRWREELLHLNYRDMRDMGVTPADVEWEASQPFWREAPPR